MHTMKEASPPMGGGGRTLVPDSPGIITTSGGKRITLRERVGRGGAAVVYRGEDVCTGMQVAVKIFDQHLHGGKEGTETFLDEVGIAFSVSSPRLIRVLDTAVVGDRYCLVMEYAAGGNLQQELDRHGPMSLDILRQRALSLAEALTDLHEQGVIHGDVKPHNVMIGPDGLLKLTDYGSARRLLDGVASGPATSAVTAAYLAPEQALGQPLGRYTDIYALGVILYVLATGRPPFEGTSPVALAMAHLDQEPEPPSRFRSDISAAFERIVLRCLAKDPQQRYQRADEIVPALRALGADLRPVASLGCGWMRIGWVGFQVRAA